MLISKIGCLASSRSTFDKSFFDKERLIDILYRAGICTKSSGDGCKTYRAAIKLINNSCKDLIIYFIKAVLIDIQCLKSITCNVYIYFAVSFYLGEISDTT